MMFVAFIGLAGYNGHPVYMQVRHNAILLPITSNSTLRQRPTPWP